MGENSNGKKDGLWKYYHDNGQLRSAVNYKKYGEPKWIFILKIE